MYYGDATRLDLLRTAGAGRRAVLVVAIDDIEQSLECVDLAREHFPQLPIVARARNVTHFYELRERGVTHIERETFDSALMSGAQRARAAGLAAAPGAQPALRFRRHNLAAARAMAPHFKDEAQLIAIAKQGRQQLEELWARERQQARGAPGAARREPGPERAAASSSSRPRFTVGLRRSGRLPRRQPRAAREQLRRSPLAEIADEVGLDLGADRTRRRSWRGPKPLIGAGPRPSARAARMK